MADRPPLLLIVAGGTGGHLYPGIAVARSVVREGSARGWRVAFVVRRGDIGKELLRREGFDVLELSGQGWPRRFSLRMFTFAFHLGAGFSQAWALLRERRPKAVLGMGGYLSFPVLLAAHLQRIPTMIHEQNVIPGLSNRQLARWANSVAVSFPESLKVFGVQKAWVSGLPIRPEIGQVEQADGRRRLGLQPDKVTFLIFGGSLGAERINRSALEAWSLLSDLRDRFQIVHITGEKLYEPIQRGYQSLPVRSTVMPYCHEMSAALAASDLVVCRAGASTVAELVAVKRPAVLVPYPFASENHQFYNAEALVERGCAIRILDNELRPQQLAEICRNIIEQPAHLADWKSKFIEEDAKWVHGAAHRIADHIFKTYA
jgi:UDP-N-acetylglucosamine--N-acetylmuramyl-(pentapeptide) pyrophosphoryl-undecaprenol N-acetylglucosamine transferase